MGFLTMSFLVNYDLFDWYEVKLWASEFSMLLIIFTIFTRKDFEFIGDRLNLIPQEAEVKVIHM